jgi:predicted Zn-dependent protease
MFSFKLFMRELEPPDLHYVSGAVGWLGLGNIDEARAELAHVSNASQHHPDTLEVRWILCATQNRWQEGLQIARTLLHMAPERSSGWLHQAYALKRVSDGGVRKAWAALLPAFDQFPQEPVIPYNLSCYACEMQQLDAARTWIKRALIIGGHQRIKTMALKDADLRPLWPEIVLM